MPRAVDAIWWGAVAAGAMGIGGMLGGAAWGASVAAIAGIALADVAWTKYGERRPPLQIVFLGLLGGALAALASIPVRLPLSARFALAFTGFQLLVAAGGLRITRGGGAALARRVLTGMGHATVLLSSSLALRGGSFASVVTTAAAGFTLLLLTAAWSQRERGGLEDEWEALLILALLVLLGAPLLASFHAPDALVLGLMLGAFLVSLAVLARPPLPTGGMSRLREGSFPMVAQALAAITIVNVIIFAWSLVSGILMSGMLLVFAVWLAASVIGDYRGVVHAWTSRRRRGGPLRDVRVDMNDITIVVVARSEARVLGNSLATNAAQTGERARFLIVPAVDSTDDTLDVAHAFVRAHPGRASVLLGATGTKAGDLNLAWPQLVTRYAVLLDADEVVDVEFLRRGIARLESESDIGIVQGRKVPRATGTLTSRLARAERRYSTLVDQLAHEARGAGHFAGSGAIVRRQAIVDAGGFDAQALTEDIELSLRMTLRTRWRIVYDARMVVRESPPRGPFDLLDQRTRWARGWVQVTGTYFSEVLRSSAHLGAARRASLAWQLLAAVSAPLSSLLPVLTLLRVTGLLPWFPPALAIALALVVLPARAIAFATARALDADARRDPGAFLFDVGAAYFWIAFGWVVQFHALYLELSDAPKQWLVTRKFDSVASAEPAA